MSLRQKTQEKGVYIAARIKQIHHITSGEKLELSKMEDDMVRGLKYLVRSNLAKKTNEGMNNALEYSLLLLNLAVEDPEAWFTAALAAREFDLEESIQFFDYLLSLEPKNDRYLFNYGVVLYKLGDVKKAKKIMLELVEIKEIYNQNNLVKKLVEA